MEGYSEVSQGPARGMHAPARARVFRGIKGSVASGPSTLLIAGVPATRAGRGGPGAGVETGRENRFRDRAISGGGDRGLTGHDAAGFLLISPSVSGDGDGTAQNFLHKGRKDTQVKRRYFDAGGTPRVSRGMSRELRRRVISVPQPSAAPLSGGRPAANPEGQNSGLRGEPRRVPTPGQE